MSEIATQPRAAGLGARSEDGVAAIVALGIVLLPLADVVAREVFDTFVPAAAPLTGHLTLILGLLGAAIAARDGKLLSLATGGMLPAGIRPLGSVLAAAVGAAVATVLAFGGVGLLRLHKEGQNLIAIGVPVWIADLAFPIGFGLIAIRLVWKSSSSWVGRAIAALGIVVGAVLAQRPELIEGVAIWPGIALLIVAAVCGMPIFGLLGGAAVFLFLAQGDVPATVLIGSYEQLISADLAALPLFTLAGFLLAEGHASDRLLRLFRACFGWLSGGTAIIATTLCAFFTVFTGGSGVTILALGGLLLPALLADGYRPRFSLGLVTAAGSLGLLFPPALPLILYGFIAGVSISDLFIGGLIPGVVMLIFLSLLGVREAIAVGTKRTTFDAREAAAAFWNAKWELLLPIVILGSLLIGATPLQSSALAALFAIIVQRFVHRDLKRAADVRRVMSDSISLVGGVLVILAVAVGFTQYLVDAQVPEAMLTWTRAHIDSPWVFLLALNGVLLIVGSLMDIFSATVVVVPLIARIAPEFGIDPIHLGIIFVANLELGYLTPPVGLNLFVSSYRFGKPVLEVARATFPMLLVLAVSVLLITYVPWLTTGLLGWLK